MPDGNLATLRTRADHGDAPEARQTGTARLTKNREHIVEKFGVVGGGIVGISVGLALQKRFSKASVTLFEKESSLGTHASGRNSGVLHSGLYYTADSLKARFSREGNRRMKQLCRDHELPIVSNGKIIVSTDALSESKLDDLENRAGANKVEIERRDSKDLSKFAPGAKTFDSFIFVRSTAVADPRSALDALKIKFLSNGGQIRTNELIDGTALSESIFPIIADEEFDFIINAAGAGSLEIAKHFGVGKDYLIAPFLGTYLKTTARVLLAPIPIYPTPHPTNAFLGVHLTPTLDGYTKIGPTAIPVMGLEQYRLSAPLNPKQVLDSSRAAFRILAGNHHSLTDFARDGLANLRRADLIQQAAKLFEPIGDPSDWQRVSSGIRAQLVDKEGKLVDDFVVERAGSVIHVLNAVSPGWTSALPFGEWIVDSYIT